MPPRTKVSKETADYRLGRGDKRCERCTMYRPRTLHEGACSAVRGVIEPNYVCDYFERKAATSNEGKSK